MARKAQPKKLQKKPPSKQKKLPLQKLPLPPPTRQPSRPTRRLKKLLKVKAKQAKKPKSSNREEIEPHMLHPAWTRRGFLCSQGYVPLRLLVSKYLARKRCHPMMLLLRHLFRHVLVLGIALYGACPLSAQGHAREGDLSPKGGTLLAPNISYGFQLPAADLARRFGSNLTVGIGLEWMSARNWFVGLHHHYFFGQQVKEDPLALLRDADGNIPGENGEPAYIRLRLRGFASGLHFGRLLSLSANPRAGLRLEGGAGILQHKIRVQEDPQSFVALVHGPYKKGWDRLSWGLSLRQFIGWQTLSENRRINFYIGIELEEAFTRNRRDYDFATMGPLPEKRFDMLVGLRAGWILPFYLNEDPETIYY